MRSSRQTVIDYDRGENTVNSRSLFGVGYMNEAPEPRSVSRWIHELKSGDDAAATQLWERYYRELVQLAEKCLGTSSRRVMDGEDVVVDAFDSFVKSAQAGRFPDLNDRDDMWALLITITSNKALDQIRFLYREKRGPQTRGDSVISDTAMPPAISHEPTPQDAVELTEFMHSFLERLNEKHRDVFLMKLEGFTNIEIANTLPPSLATVERYLRSIREQLSNYLTNDRSDQVKRN